MYGSRSRAVEYVWQFRRRLGISPTQRLFREIQKRTRPLSEMDALEMFAGDGGRHTLDYQHMVRSLEAWEFARVYENRLRTNLPRARIVMTDSFRELQTTTNTFDLIVIDCPGGLYGPDRKYCSHFELFTPSLFRIARGSAIIVVNVTPDALASSGKAKAPGSAGQTPELGELLSRRGAFYATGHPQLLSFEKMIEAYKRIASAAGFDLKWHLQLCRTIRSKAYYLAMGLTRN